jgi:hypothetical protein
MNDPISSYIVSDLVQLVLAIDPHIIASNMTNEGISRLFNSKLMWRHYSRPFFCTEEID